MMLLEHHGENSLASLVMKAIEDQVAERNIRTPDLGGGSTTWEVGDDLEQRIRKMTRMV